MYVLGLSAFYHDSAAALLGALIVLSQGSVIAPFIYTIF